MASAIASASVIACVNQYIPIFVLPLKPAIWVSNKLSVVKVPEDPYPL